MKEIGKVTKIDNGYATVTVTKREECAKCGACGMTDNMTGIDFKCKAINGVLEGDIVSIELSDLSKLIASVLAFLVPLLILGISLLLGYLFIKNDLIICLITIIAIIVWYAFLGIIDKKIKNKNKFIPQIIDIIKKNNGENENG